MPSKLRDSDLVLDEETTHINPYSILSLSPDATQDQVKSAYRKAALKHHPDKAAPEDKDAAHTRFQEIAFAYAILSDERRRRRYDTTGRTEESLDLDDDEFDWATFFREQFENVITEETIGKFAEGYKGSEEERGHVLEAYEKCKGLMEKVYQLVMLSDMVDDEERFRKIIDAAIEEGEVEAYKKYTEESEAARKKRMDRARKRKEKDAKEAEEALKEMEDDPKSKKGKAKKAGGGMDDLAALIQQRQKGRAEGFFDHLEEKYASDSTGGKGKKGSKRAMDEPPEEAFAKNRKAAKVSEEDDGDAAGGAGRSRKRSSKA